MATRAHCANEEAEQNRNARLGRAQRCVVYSRESPEGTSCLYRYPNTTDDHFGLKHPPLHAATHESAALHVQVSIPTLGLRNYLFETVESVLAAVKDGVNQGALPHTSVAILSNGPSDSETRRAFIRQFVQGSAQSVGVALITTGVLGKPNALNILHQHAAAQGVDHLVFMDDDIRIQGGGLQKICQRLATGDPMFLGAQTLPERPPSDCSVEADIYHMTSVKRRMMGFPVPIGRFMALPTTLFPTITDFHSYDDVYLSAFFMIHKVKQEVVSDVGVTYPVSSSLYQFLRRRRRIAHSDAAILKLLPDPFAERFRDLAIKPPRVNFPRPTDTAWLAIAAELDNFAARTVFRNHPAVSLNETDLSSKSNDTNHRHGEREQVLRAELIRLKQSLGV